MRRVPCLVLLLVACAHRASGPGGDEALHRVFDEYYDEELALNPTTATSLGEHRYDDRLENEISDEHRARTADMCRRYLARLGAFDPARLGAADRLSHELLRHDLAERLEGLAFPDHLLAVTQLSGQPVDFPVMGSGAGIHPFQTVIDYERFLRRIDGFVVWVDTAIANMRRGIADGVVASRIVVDKTLPQLDAQIVDDVAKSPFFEPIRQLPAGFAAADRTRLEAAYRAAIRDRIVPAYRRLRDFMRREYLPRCRATVGLEALPNGAAWYAYRVRSETTTTMAPDEIFRLGESEVARIEGEMLRLRDGAGFRGDLQAFARSLARAPGGFTTRPALLAGYEALRTQVTSALPRLFGRLPRAAFEIRAVEPFREESAPSQYVQPTPDGSRRRVFYVNMHPLADGPMRVAEDLFAHEALPGHHFQIALQLEQTGLPRFRRLAHHTAYVEGWALYAEGLGGALGLYRDPAQELERLGAEIFRAVRLVVDVGLHHRGWTRDQALAYYRQHVVSTTEDAAAGAPLEIDRYIAWPGQALAYKMGQLRIASLRARAAAALGGRFDPRAFHDEVLRNGPVPLDVLERLVDTWIARGGRG